MYTHAYRHTCMHTDTYTPVAYEGNETEEKVFKEGCVSDMTLVCWIRLV